MKTLRVLLLLWLASVGAGAFAQSAPLPFVSLVWTGTGGSGTKSPAYFCQTASSDYGEMLVAKAWLGFPTQFVCVTASGTSPLNQVFSTMPSCPTGYHVDLPLQLCALDAVDSGSSDGSDIPLTSSEIASIWTVGFGLVVVCFLLGRAVGAVVEFIRKG